MTKLLLLSGGLDSSTIMFDYHAMGEDIMPLYVYKKAYAAPFEQRAARNLCKLLGLTLETVDASHHEYGERGQWHERIMILHGAAPFAKLNNCDTIVFGDEGGTDRWRPDEIENRDEEQWEFLDELRSELEPQGLELETPIPHLLKTELMGAIGKVWRDYGVSPAHTTYSCNYMGKGGQECGRCWKCFRKYAALRWGNYTHDESISGMVHSPAGTTNKKRVVDTLAWLRERQPELPMEIREFERMLGVFHGNTR